MFPDLPFDYEQCFEEDERLKKSDIEELRTWIQGLPSNSYIPKNISDKMLVIVHCACDFKVEHTKKCLSVCYEIRFKDPKLFNGRDVDTEEMQLAFRTL